MRLRLLFGQDTSQWQSWDKKKLKEKLQYLNMDNPATRDALILTLSKNAFCFFMLLCLVSFIGGIFMVDVYWSKVDKTKYLKNSRRIKIAYKIVGEMKVMSTCSPLWRSKKIWKRLTIENLFIDDFVTVLILKNQYLHILADTVYATAKYFRKRIKLTNKVSLGKLFWILWTPKKMLPYTAVELISNKFLFVMLVHLHTSYKCVIPRRCFSQEA